jgi:hypothetical protein
MPRKTEIIDTFYRGVAADGEVIKESKSKTAVERPMRHHPDGTIETRDLVGYFTPWTPVPKEDPK